MPVKDVAWHRGRPPQRWNVRGDYVLLGVLSGSTSKDAINVPPPGKALKMGQSPLSSRAPGLPPNTKHSPAKKQRKRRVELASVSSQDRLGAN